MRLEAILDAPAERKLDQPCASIIDLRWMSGMSPLRGHAEAKDTVPKNRVRYNRIGGLGRSTCYRSDAAFMRLNGRKVIIMVPDVVPFCIHGFARWLRQIQLDHFKVAVQLLHEHSANETAGREIGRSRMSEPGLGMRSFPIAIPSASSGLETSQRSQDLGRSAAQPAASVSSCRARCAPLRLRASWRSPPCRFLQGR